MDFHRIGASYIVENSDCYKPDKKRPIVLKSVMLRICVLNDQINIYIRPFCRLLDAKFHGKGKQFKEIHFKDVC